MGVNNLKCLEFQIQYGDIIVYILCFVTEQYCNIQLNCQHCTPLQTMVQDAKRVHSYYLYIQAIMHNHSSTPVNLQNDSFQPDVS